MTNDDFRPRENDHLVEPMFAGLGVGEEEEKDDVEGEEGARPEAGGLLAAIARFLRRLFG